MSDMTTTKQILLTRRSPAYWRVTINHPPLNIFGPDTIPQLNEIITAIETATLFFVSHRRAALW
jgi:enoyl-CoA hydratase/carnithine racemase